MLPLLRPVVPLEAISERRVNLRAKHRILANPDAQPEVDTRADLVRRLQAAWDRVRALPDDPQLSLLAGETA